jgi:hypothetical protein
MKVFTKFQINASTNGWEKCIQNDMGTDQPTDRSTDQWTVKSFIEALCSRLKIHFDIYHNNFFVCVKKTVSYCLLFTKMNISGHFTKRMAWMWSNNLFLCANFCISKLRFLTSGPRGSTVPKGQTGLKGRMGFMELIGPKGPKWPMGPTEPEEPMGPGQGAQ